MFADKERKIKEIRTHEAMKNKLMGPGGKFGIIVKNLGQKILVHNSSAFLDTRFLEQEEDFEINFDNETILQGDYDDSTTCNGWHFDGLSRGIHLEIRYLEHAKELTVHYKGYLIFREISGDLKAYNPQKEWEEKVDRLYQSASAIKAERDKNKNADDSRQKKVDWLAKVNEMRLRWGL